MITISITILLVDDKGNETGDIIIIDKRNAVSVESSLFDRADIKRPSYGIFSNQGVVEFKDRDGTILNYANNGMLQKGAKVKFDIVNTIHKIGIDPKTNTIATMKTDSWNYDNESKIVRVEFSDNLEIWQNQNTKYSKEFDPEKPRKNVSFNAILRALSIDNNVSFHDVVSGGFDLGKIFVGTYIPIKNKSFWNVMDSFCRSTQTHVFCDESGNAVCYYNGGN